MFYAQDIFLLPSLIIIYTGCLKKGTPTWVCLCALITECMNVIDMGAECMDIKSKALAVE